MRRWINILLIITVILFLVGTVSASDWSGIDNYKVFQEEGKYGRIEIWDTATTILFQPDDRKLVEYTLIDNTDQCLINCHAEGTATLYEDGKLFSGLKFRDRKGKSIGLKNKILIWNNYEVEVEVNDYKEVCEDVFNETNKGEICHDEIIGTHKETRTREGWVEYNFETLGAGDYKWRIEGTKDLGQSIDWIGTSFGKELTEWAWWNNDWGMKKAVNIDTILLEKNHTSTLINVTYEASMQNDFDDLRFVDDSETTEINYWFYNNSYVASNSVQVWLNTGNLSITENRTYYMYYKNAGASTTSNIDTAFWFADDFNGSDVDFTDRWQSTAEGNYAVSGGIMTGTDVAASTNMIETQDKFASEYVIESRIATVDAGLDIYTLWSSPDVATFPANTYGRIEADNFKIILTTSQSGGTPLDNVYYRSRAEIKTNPCNANWSSDTLTNLFDYQENCGNSIGYIGFLPFLTDLKVDWVYIRRYMSTEPTVSFGAEESFARITAAQSYPPDYFNTTDTTPDLSCNFTGIGSENITDVTVFVYDSGNNLDYTDTEGSLVLKSYNKTWTTTELTNDTYLWACLGEGDTTEDYAGNRTLTIDATAPLINITYPIDYVNYQILGENLTVNWTVSDTHLQSCWYDYNTTNISVACYLNTTQFNVTSYSNRNLTFYANDSFGNSNSSFISWDYKLFENLVDYNTSTYETSAEDFFINFSSVGLQTITANFYYGGVDKGTGTKTGDNNEMTFTKSIDIPASTGNKTIYWKISYGAETINSPNINQTVNPIFLTYCNASNNITFLNFTFKDETDGSILYNVTNDLADFPAFWLGGGSVTKSHSTSNFSINPSYSFCFIPPDKTLTTDLTFKYAQTGYPLRTFAYNNQALTNLTTNKTLYLLSAVNGIYVTFQVLSQAEQPISSVYSLAHRQISGVHTLVGSGYTGGDGGVTFWLNPDYEHTFNFSKAGYPSVSETLTPTQSTYTIYMGTNATVSNVSDYSRGIRYTIDPADYVLNQSSTYSFNFNLTSEYWSLDSFGFSLTNGTGGGLGSNSSTTGSGGNVSLVLNVGTNKSIVMEYYWIIDGDSTNFTRMWSVMNVSETEWSLRNFFDDLKTYTDEGVFGLTEFGRTLIIFLIIFISVGLISYYSGMYSPAAILTMVFVLVAFFDFGLGIIPNPVRAINHFPTFLVALLAIGVWINEWRRG